MSSYCVSVVIASLVGAPFLDECLESLERQAKDNGAEVLVVFCGTTEDFERLAGKFPWVRFLYRKVRETVPDLRRHGVEAASGDLVAIIEEHCTAAPDWLVRLMEAHAGGDYGVVGGPVADSSYDRLVDWTVYFCEYNGYLPPWREGEPQDLGSANIAYRRTVLMQHKNQLGAGYWEAGLHPILRAGGVNFRPAPTMLVYHRGPFPYGYYLRQRYWFSRAFSGARNLPASRKAIYCLASPLLPFLLLARMGQRVFHKRCHVGKFLQCVPVLIPVLLVYVAGELAGYLAGPGDALSKVE